MGYSGLLWVIPGCYGLFGVIMGFCRTAVDGMSNCNVVKPPGYEKSYVGLLYSIRHKLQKQVRQAFWAYMETIIDFTHPDDRATKERFWSFIRSVWKDSSGVSPLHSEGEIHSSAEKKAEIVNRQYVIQYSLENLPCFCQTKALVPILLCHADICRPISKEC